MADQQNAVKSMTENSRDAARLIARDQQKVAGKKVHVIAIADGFDGFKYREEGERFIAWWVEIPKGKDEDPKAPPRYKQPSWQMEQSEFDKKQKAAAKEEREGAEVGE